MKKVLLALNAVLVFSAMAWAAPATFDDLSLDADSFWNGQSKWDAAGNPYPPTPAESPFNYDSGFTSSGIDFNNRFTATTYGQEYPYTYYTSWSGFAYSNMTDTTTSGYTNQYSVYTGAAYSGENFGVAYYMAWGGLTPTITFSRETTPTSLQMTNTTYAALSMKDGDMFTPTMAEGDWFKVTISAKDDAGLATGTPIDVILAEYQVGGSRNIVDEWLNVNLTPLGNEVKSIEFTVSSWDASQGAESYWPTYFAVDNVVPEPATIGLLSLGGTFLITRRRNRRMRKEENDV